MKNKIFFENQKLNLKIPKLFNLIFFLRQKQYMKIKINKILFFLNLIWKINKMNPIFKRKKLDPIKSNNFPIQPFRKSCKKANFRSFKNKISPILKTYNFFLIFPNLENLTMKMSRSTIIVPTLTIFETTWN